jgi:hypothetical protein
MEKPRVGQQSGLGSTKGFINQPLILAGERNTSPTVEYHTNQDAQPRLMTPEEEAVWGPILDLRQESALNRARFDPALLAQYEGELIAWSRDGTRIIAHAKDDETVYRLLDEAGEDPGLCLVEYIGDDDTEV